MCQCGQKPDRGCDLACHPQQNKLAVTRGQPDDQHTGPPRHEGKRRHSDQRAQKDTLIDGHVGEQRFHQPVIQNE